MHHDPTAIGPPAPPGSADATDVARAVVEARDALSPREVAQRTGLSYHAVLREIHRGALQAKQVCDGSRILIPIDAYRAWLEPSDVETTESGVVRYRRRRAAAKASPTQSGSFERLLALEEESAA